MAIAPVNAVSSNDQQQMQLEKEKAEVTAAEKALVEKTIEGTCSARCYKNNFAGPGPIPYVKVQLCLQDPTGSRGLEANLMKF